jgi:hypothetical protein
MKPKTHNVIKFGKAYDFLFVLEGDSTTSLRVSSYEPNKEQY